MTNTNLDILNQVQDLVIDQANAAGENLSDTFATVEDFKKFIIALTFKGLRDAGMDVSEAFDATLGAESYDALSTRVSS